MSIVLTFLGHAGFLLESDDTALVIDPFLTDNPVAKHKPDEIKCGHIALTHGHADHVGDTVAIARANDAMVYGAFELCEYLGGQGVSTSSGNPGGKIETDFGFVAFTQAFHSSSYEGQYMGPACGVVVNIAGVTVYHCGDTGLFSDMKLIGEIYKPDIACVPIGDRLTMGPELGARAAELIGARITIPIHFGTWPMLVESSRDFSPHGVKVHDMQPGMTLRYG
ncbi:MAG: metal-dependent hydrolase [Phycisphaerae bacterium]|nr:metal-dependent hydrolase [Phycisphaerae bacterium]